MPIVHIPHRPAVVSRSASPSPGAALPGYVGGRVVPEVPVEVPVRAPTRVTGGGRWGTGTVR